MYHIHACTLYMATRTHLNILFFFIFVCSIKLKNNKNICPIYMYNTKYIYLLLCFTKIKNVVSCIIFSILEIKCNKCKYLYILYIPWFDIHIGAVYTLLMGRVGKWNLWKQNVWNFSFYFFLWKYLSIISIYPSC